MQPEVDNEFETFGLILLMLWECRNALVDLKESKRAACVEQCIHALFSSNLCNLTQKFPA
jgi:hypothetical protein